MAENTYIHTMVLQSSFKKTHQYGPYQAVAAVKSA